MVVAADLLASCLSSSCNESVEEQARDGSADTEVGGLVREMNSPVLDGGDGKKLNPGAGVITPLKLGDLDICFPTIVAGSCNGNQHEYFISWTTLRFSTTVLIVGLSDGSFWRHLCAMSAIVRAAFIGKRPLR